MVVEYATGPTNVLENTYISKPFDSASHQLCNSQKIKAPPGSGAVSFSTLGVSIIIAIGGLLILGHTILDYVISNVIPTRNYKLVRWAIDDKLQLQRLAFEGASMGTWKAGIGSAPTTTSRQLFGMEIGGEERHPTIFTQPEEDKALETVRVDSVNSAMTPVSTKPEADDRHRTSIERVDSYQLPPMRFDDADHEIWPFTDTSGVTPPHQPHAGRRTSHVEL